MSIGNPPDITGLATALICIHGVGVNGPFEKLTPLPPFTYAQIPKYGLWEMGNGKRGKFLYILPICPFEKSSMNTYDSGPKYKIKFMSVFACIVEISKLNLHNKPKATCAI